MRCSIFHRVYGLTDSRVDDLWSQLRISHVNVPYESLTSEK